MTGLNMVPECDNEKALFALENETRLFAPRIRSYSKSSEIERVLNVNIPEIVYSRKARV